MQKKETVNITSARTSANDHQYRNKFVNKLFNKIPNETVRSTKTRVVDSKSNEQTNTTNEKNNTTFHRGNLGNKINCINRPISRSASEEEMGKTERIFSLRMTDTPLCTKEKEKKRNFSSRLPIRTWKRLRTKEPATLRLESNIMNEMISQKLQKIEIETKNSNNHLRRVEDNKTLEEVTQENCATANRNDIKQNNRLKTRLFSADKPRLTSSNLKDLNLKGLNTTKGIQWNKRKNIK